jgi:uncharacterized alkaline shock family protein YloU
MDEKSNPGFSNEYFISEEVIASIVINSVKDIDGVSGFVHRPADVQSFFKIGREPLRFVKVYVNDTEIMLHLHIKIKDGQNIPALVTKVQHTAKEAVQNMTGRIVTKVNVNVAGMDFDEPTETID